MPSVSLIILPAQFVRRLTNWQDEGKLAELIRGRFPTMEMLRFTNSGTEATLMALAAAKAYTKKDKIIVFGGAYHGGAFSFAGGKSSAVNAPHEYVRTGLLIHRFWCRIVLDRMIDDEAYLTPLSDPR